MLRAPYFFVMIRLCQAKVVDGVHGVTAFVPGLLEEHI